jgi:CelD/BcsL family acetyltransferase involved in cellulose biosynthesis
MRGISCADLTIETFATAEAVRPDVLALIDGATSLFDTVPWWNAVLKHAMLASAEGIFVVIRCRGRVAAVVPMLRTHGQLSSLTTPYTCVYRPLIGTGLDPATRIAAMAVFARFCRSAGIVRLEALPAEWDGLADLEIGVRQAGLVPLRFDHFGNWSEDVAGLAWSAYLLRRPGALRETIRRRLRRAEKLPDARFNLFTRPDHMDQAAEAFESVYRRSWKDAERYPEFNVALMRAMAELGWLRLGVWSVGTEPVAVQFWVVKAGQAIVLKLAHDEAFTAHSPGTVLTALMVRHLLDNEHVARIDFGRGDDTYKQGWAVERLQRIGVLLVNPWRLAGIAALLRHAAGRIRGSFRALPGTLCHRSVARSPVLVDRASPARP